MILPDKKNKERGLASIICIFFLFCNTSTTNIIQQKSSFEINIKNLPITLNYYLFLISASELHGFNFNYRIFH